VSKQRNSKRRKYLRAAARASDGVRDAVASKWSKAKQRRYDNRKLGTFGAASPVRIVMKDGQPVDQSGERTNGRAAGATGSDRP
jgi:hypothetical protein